MYEQRLYVVIQKGSPCKKYIHVVIYGHSQRKVQNLSAPHFNKKSGDKEIKSAKEGFSSAIFILFVYSYLIRNFYPPLAGVEILMEYELLFFTSVANEDKIESIKKDIIEILESLDGKLSGDFSDIGKRKLAHPIKRNTHAFFSFVRFELQDESRQNIPEIGKRLSLYGDIMRHIIVRADEIGKPIISQEIKFAEEKTERRARGQKEKPIRPLRVEKQVEEKPEAKPVEKKPKTALSDLDEKLSEILEETPE